MSKILKNNTASPITISDTGITVPASGQYTIPAQDYALWAASDNIVTEIGSGNITVNDGSNDLGISDGTDLIKGIFQKNRIIGDSDDTLIGNVSDSLKVHNTNPISISPGNNDPMIRKVQPLLNSGSKNMVVNGSVTPVDFEWVVPTGEVWYLDKISCNLGASNDPDASDFAGGAALSNGLDIILDINGTEYVVTNLKDNKDVTGSFDTDTTLGTTDSKWFKDSGGRFFHGNMDFKLDMPLKQSTGDKVIARVRDNLTTNSVLFLNMYIHIWRFL